MREDFDPHQHSNGPEAEPKKDCGCGGCGGDCEEARKPENRARRSFLLGAGTTVVATLVNHRAFAGGATCGPLSHAASLTPSANGQTSGCGGLTPGYWAQHQDVSGAVLGFTEPKSNPNYQADLKTFLTGKTLGSLLPNLALIDPTAAGQNFCQVFTPPRDDPGFHWACAILNAMASVSPFNYTPQYGYTLTELNNAIQNAYNNHVSSANILAAIETLENDYSTNNAPGGAALYAC